MRDSSGIQSTQTSIDLITAPYIVTRNQSFLHNVHVHVAASLACWVVCCSYLHVHVCTIGMIMCDSVGCCTEIHSCLCTLYTTAIPTGVHVHCIYTHLSDLSLLFVITLFTCSTRSSGNFSWGRMKYLNCSRHWVTCRYSTSLAAKPSSLRS